MTIKAMRGCALVRCRERARTSSGPIVIPSTVHPSDRASATHVGVVEDLKIDPADPQQRHDPDIQTLTGKRVAFTHYVGTPLPWDGPGEENRDIKLYRVPIASILGILEGEGEATVEGDPNQVPRCQYCGPARPGTKQTMILMEHGPDGEYICPRCRRNRQGVVRPRQA